MEKGVLRCVEIVSRPYAQVRDTILANPQGWLVRARGAACAQAAAIRIRSGAFDVGVDLDVTVTRIDHGGMARSPSTTLTLVWRGQRPTAGFPTLVMTLVVAPVGDGRAPATRLELSGELGPQPDPACLDIELGRRMARAAAQHFLRDLAHGMRGLTPMAGMRLAT